MFSSFAYFLALMYNYYVFFKGQWVGFMFSHVM